MFSELISSHRKLLSIASESKQPNDNTFDNLLKPEEVLIQKISDITQNNRQSPFFVNLSTVSEGSGVFGWVRAVCVIFLATITHMMKIVIFTDTIKQSSL